MFCKNCGSNIKDDSKFCPKCGKVPTEGGSDPGGVLANYDKGKVRSKKGLWMFILTAVAAAAMIACAVCLNSQKQYSIVGEWISMNQVNTEEVLNNYLDEALGDGLMDGLQAGLIKKTIGKTLDATADNLTLVFYKRGEYGIFTGGGRISFFDHTYEQMPNQKLNLNWKLNLSIGADVGIKVVDVGAGLDVPLSLSYIAKCRVGKNTMTLDFFGEELEFQRQ